MASPVRTAVTPSRFHIISLRPLAAWVGACIGATLLVTLSWWAVLSPGARTPNADELVIREGTAEAIAKGYPVFLPSVVSIRPGGTLRLVNEDTAQHTVGEVTIPPGATAELTAPADGTAYSCTIHPGGSLGFNVATRPPLWQAIVGATATGIVFGAIGAGVTAVTGKLDAG